MSDLISRKQISNYIKAQINPYGKPFYGTTYELGLKIMEYIDNMNSAYDVDKVVKELEEIKAIKSDGFTDNLLNMGYTKGIKDGYVKAIDEFAEKLKEKSTFLKFIENDYYGYVSEDEIDEIAEQMKGRWS